MKPRSTPFAGCGLLLFFAACFFPPASTPPPITAFFTPAGVSGDSVPLLPHLLPPRGPSVVLRAAAFSFAARILLFPILSAFALSQGAAALSLDALKSVHFYSAADFVVNATVFPRGSTSSPPSDEECLCSF